MATLLAVAVVLIVCTTQRQITCRQRPHIIPTTIPYVPSQKPTSYPKVYPGKIPFPCINLRVTLETENILPLNIEPDEATNINLISQTLTQFTGGTAQLLQSPDFDEDYAYPEQLKWEIPHHCMIDNQKTDIFLPTEKTDVLTGTEIVTKTYDSFTIRYPLTTHNSNLYAFDIISLSLNIATDCTSGDLIVSGAIYKDNEFIAKTDNVQISSKETRPLPRLFHFDKYISLTASSEYEARHELIGGYPIGCSFNNVQLGTFRRRLQATTEQIEALGTPNSCKVGTEVARSEEMRKGVEAMCNGNLDTKSIIQQGLFRQHSSQAAIKNFLIKSGSLILYNSDGTVQFSDDKFPENFVEDPCIAVDEDNNIIYAIGGRLPDGSASDQIQAYQFNDDSLTTGNIIDLNGWSLDKPRYGATCFFWNDNGDGKLFVMSGMARTDSEFVNKNVFYQDMRIFPVPEDPSQYIPTSDGVDDKRLEKNVIDNKPLLIGDTLYFFGGKTHKASKNFILRFKLTEIRNANAAVLEQVRMITNVSLPLIDVIQANFGAQGVKSCYMVFGGQVYKDFLIDGDVQTTPIELYCNENIPFVRRRRLMEQQTHVLNFTAFDLEMLRKGRSKNNDMEFYYNTDERRLAGYYQPKHSIQTGTSDKYKPQYYPWPSTPRYPTKKPHVWTTPRPTYKPHVWTTKKPTYKQTPYPTRAPVDIPISQVFFRDYNFHKDGYWYNFSADSLICYNDSYELNKAVKFYENIIADKPGELWMDWKHKMDTKLLDMSLESFSGWSDGFGCVDVSDIAILDVNYAPTPNPTSHIWPTPKPTYHIWPTPKPTYHIWPTPKPPTYHIWPTLNPSVCCQCLQINENQPGCSNDPQCEKLICQYYNMNYCCQWRWGVPCTSHAVSKCNNYKTCCGCLTSVSFGGCHQDSLCEQMVCNKNPLCCNNQWNNECVSYAHSVCSSEETSTCCGCAKASYNYGCVSDIKCQEMICQEDDYCCKIQWDNTCARKAGQKCQYGAQRYVAE